mmetsp:Transcript_87220/g.247693  ORF Transcript_87220/g.247693 Transcript_87220/m.247693 type:complete len:195 (-) Transcript_87220:123-707(-)
MSSAFDFAAATPSTTSVELGAAKSSWGSGKKKKPAAKSKSKSNPFDVGDFGDSTDLEASLLDHESENVSSQERALLSRISNVRYITEEELMDEEMQARDNAMGRLNQDVHKIHEVFSDLREIVGEQQEAVDQVEEDVDAAHSRAESGVKQLHGAIKKQRAGSRCFIIALATLAVVACVVVVSFAFIIPRISRRR